MNQITGTIQNIFSDRPLQEDEYRNESDNLIHCAKCKTPRQHHVVVLGKEMVVPIRCRCQQEVQDKEEAERKHREFLDQVSRLKANGLQDKSLREYTFANDKGYNPEMQKRVSNVIRAIAESDNNPVISIHDHGAGGHLNCLSVDVGMGNFFL
jgi:DNA replication protein DnaC